jgi:hypothetical protein
MHVDVAQAGYYGVLMVDDSPISQTPNHTGGVVET